MSEIYHISKELSSILCEKYHTFLSLKNSAGGPRMAAGPGEYSLPALLLSMRGGGASRRPRPTGVTAQGRAATWGRPYKNTKACPVNAVGAGHWPARRGASAIPEPPSSASLRSAPSPWKGEGLRAGHGPAPTAESGPGALVRQSQARKWNRTGPNFPHIQGPVARREFRTPLRFCAPEMLCPPQGVTPVMGSGERRL